MGQTFLPNASSVNIATGMGQATWSDGTAAKGFGLKLPQTVANSPILNSVSRNCRMRRPFGLPRPTAAG